MIELVARHKPIFFPLRVALLKKLDYLLILQS